MQQRTLKKSYNFSGKGLHSGKFANMVVHPAQAGTGIVFRRVDLGEDATVKAIADNVGKIARSTTITSGEVAVSTIEHLMSSFIGLGVDNAIVDIDNVEVPILDGSASHYVRDFLKDGLQELPQERQCIDIKEELEISDEKTGSWIRVKPAKSLSYAVTVDFNSKVLGVQEAAWEPSMDYSKELAPCRTFVFFHEIEYLFANNLIKGGDVDNAIVIVEHPVSQEQLSRMSQLFDKHDLQITSNGYLNNLKLHYPNECGRHKLLDLIGDLALVGGFLNAEITAYKPGHGINTEMAKKIRQTI